MNFLQKINPELPLRASLGAMYLYSSYDLIMHPGAWTWAVPFWFSRIVSAFMPLTSYLRLQGTAELVFALVLLAWFIPKKIAWIVSALSCLELLFILFFLPQFSITFRDLGVLGAAFTLFLLLFRDFSKETFGRMT